GRAPRGNAQHGWDATSTRGFQVEGSNGPLPKPQAHYVQPEQLPPGDVLVVGGGNSGFQVASELAATRTVHLSVGRRLIHLPQRLLGRDLFWWLTRLGVMRVDGASTLGRFFRTQPDAIVGTP